MALAYGVSAGDLHASGGRRRAATPDWVHHAESPQERDRTCAVRLAVAGWGGQRMGRAPVRKGHARWALKEAQKDFSRRATAFVMV